MAGEENIVLDTLLTLCLLLFAAKIGGEVAKFLGIAAVVGELLAGVLLALILFLVFSFTGVHLFNINECVRIFAELGAVMLLFLVGLETKFADFKKSGFLATIVAIGGVIVPFFLGYGLTVLWYPNNPNIQNEALLVGAALTATSIAITVKVLKDTNKFGTKESGILIGAAVIDDVLGLIVLAIVLGLVQSGTINPVDIAIVAVKSVGIWLLLTLFGVFVVAKIIDKLCHRQRCELVKCDITKPEDIDGSPGHCYIKCQGPQEASALAMCFGFAYAAGIAGLAPILGAFAAGMAISETKILPTIQEVAEKINFLMAPLFFVVIGTMVDLSRLNAGALSFAAILIALAMLGKIIGCSLPILILTKDIKQAIIIGVGMMSRGEVGLIIAGIGLSSGAFSNEVFSAVVLMVVVTTVVTPTALTYAYKKLKV